MQNHDNQAAADAAVVPAAADTLDAFDAVSAAQPAAAVHTPEERDATISESDYQVLGEISRREQVREPESKNAGREGRLRDPGQRDLARAVGLSLGMTNAILKRLAARGWLLVKKVNNRKLAYAVTPAGAEALTRRSYRYVRRTVGYVVRYKEAVSELMARLRSDGYKRVILVGESDLSFIVEHAAARNSLELVERHADKKRLAAAEVDKLELKARAEDFVLFSEKLDEKRVARADHAVPGGAQSRPGYAYLHAVLAEVT